MKKQVTFAQSQTVHQLQQHRFSLPIESKFAEDVNSRLTFFRRHSTPSDHRATVHIPKAMATAPFLKHSVLTPAQREYLYTVAASHSGALVRNLITQHYMNILHRCIRTGHSDETDIVVARVILPETIEPPKPQPEAASKQTTQKHKGKQSAAVRNSGKTFLPKIPKRQPRVVKTSASKQRKKLTTSPKLRKKSPVTVVSLDDDDDDDDFSLDDSLSDCLSSLSMGDWDDDFLSDSDSK